MRRVAVLLALSGVVPVTAGLAFSFTRLPGIRSPSGNIHCFVVPGRPSVLRCEIAHSKYAAKLQARCLAPNGTGVDWHGFELTAAGKGAVTCSGGILYNPDTERPAYVTLAYGKTWRQDAFTCTSRTTGLTCRNRAGHGLFISRESWRAW